MDAVGPLFAAGADWLDFVLPILVAIFWVVGQILNLIRRPAGAGGRPAAPPRPPRRPVAGEPPADVRVQLERQIEEFLRQSRGGPQQPAPAPRPAPPKLPTAPPTERSKTSGKKAAKPPARAAAKPAKAAPRLTDRQFVPLGDAGDDVVEHVQEAFAHDLGHRDPMLAPPPGTKAADASAVAADFAKAVRDPTVLRRLIVMREILDRPVDRWE